MSATIGARRESLLSDTSRLGRAFVVAYTAMIDEWIVELYREAIGEQRGVALVATGGYGRAELTPGSDLDLLLLHDGSVGEDEAQRLWYPVWDAGFTLGHAVRRESETMALASSDLATATALLSVRHLAGSREMVAHLADRSAMQWRKGAKRRLVELAESVQQRHGVAGEVLFDLEPDLKEGRGGLRDVHALEWAAAGDDDFEVVGGGELRAHYDTLLAARVELHRVTGRHSDCLLLQEQDEVAARLGDADVDALMARLATAARAIAWASDESWYDVRRRHGARPIRRRVAVGRGIDRGSDSSIEFVEGRVELAQGAPLDGISVLRVGLAAARHGERIGRSSLRRLDQAPVLAEPWPPAALELFEALLSCGESAIEVIESLDMGGHWCRLVPEWAPNRSRPQRNAYHRFTVDRHLLETVAQAARLADRVARPDLLLLGALCHDIGKGYPGDHAIVGIELAIAICRRIGLAAGDVETVAALVEFHLLLPDVALRRDLDDPSTIRSVATAVGTSERLELLAALTEADSIATGPSAWSRWKAGLLATLVERVAHVLRGGEVTDVTAPGARTDIQMDLVAVARAEERLVVEARANRLFLACPDRPALFSRVAAVLALNGLDVVEATAASVEGIAVDEFEVVSALGTEIAWSKVEGDLERAVMGRLAIESRLADRARRYRSRVRSPRGIEPRVRVLNEASDEATVVEVVGPDRIGLLYRLTRAMSELDLDIASAKVATIGSDVVDAFYVRDRSGNKVTGEADIAEITAGLLHVLVETPSR